MGDAEGRTGRPTWAEVDLGALRRNLALLRDRSPGRRVIAVVKAGAYGHGAAPVARTLVESGSEMLAVATVDEARELRDAGLEVPVLLLQGLHDPADADEALARRFVPAVGRLEQFDALEAASGRAGTPFPVHLKFDTGMHRLGFAPEQTVDALGRASQNSRIAVEGLMSHLACADDAASSEVEAQREQFSGLLVAARDRGLSPEWLHLDNSPGVLNGPSPATTAIRPGLALYGADPTPAGGSGLEPVMTVVTRAIHALDLPAGARVGYGGTWKAPRPTRVLTLPIGYADGLPRSTNGFALGLAGRRVPLVGRVSMDLCAVDVGPGLGADRGADAGAELLVFGRRAGLEIRAEELASASDTLAYEIFVRIGPRVPRSYAS
ncbi:MAG: alanine racemase [Deltaproteobacteria bacterium]|nr:alanine racemase [Deltaproteobacteria bacterium]MBW2415121.1 alanine racemase [Deltaproteobacteria bacterium]